MRSVGSSPMPRRPPDPDGGVSFRRHARSIDDNDDSDAHDPVCLPLRVGLRQRAAATTSTASPPAEITDADLRPDTNGGPPAIAPSRLEPLRVEGEKTIVPDGDVMLAAQKSGQVLKGSFKYCLDETGRVARVTMLQSTGVSGYDTKITAKMNQWAFRPVVVGGKTIAVCSAVQDHPKLRLDELLPGPWARAPARA